MRRSILLHLAGTLLIALTMAILWVLRPGLPSLPNSPTAQITIEQLEELLAFVGWVALIIAAILVAIGPRDQEPEHVSDRPIRDIPRAAASPWRWNRIGSTPARASLTVAVAPSGSPLHTPRADDAPIEHVPQPQLRMRLLGPPTLESAEGNVRAARSSTQEILTYLALHPRGAERDELTEAIWPGEDPRRTRQRLWQSTSEARKLVGDAFASNKGHYALDRTKVSVDADDLDRLRAAAKETATPADERRALERGLGLLRDEPLVGCDQLWSDAHAGRLRAIQAELLERLGRARLVTDDAQGALEAAELGLARDSLNEALWRLAMEAEANLGLRGAVRQRYERLRGQLDEQLGLEPESETRALLRELLGQR